MYYTELPYSPEDAYVPMFAIAPLRGSNGRDVKCGLEFFAAPVRESINPAAHVLMSSTLSNTYKKQVFKLASCPECCI